LNEILDSPETNLFVDNVSTILARIKFIFIHKNSRFIFKILAETKLVQQQLSDIQTRHNELEKLEKSIVEVRDIFLEMAFLVEKQVRTK
jgi:hypothetical protein